MKLDIQQQREGKYLRNVDISGANFFTQGIRRWDAEPLLVDQPPRIAPACGPPLWEMARAAEQARNDQQWDQASQPAPASEFDQRIAW